MTDLLKLIFLGTGAAAPSITRRSPALAIQREGEVILCDCGEGVQVRLQQAGVSPADVRTILISHLHGDHLFGLPGFLSSQQLFKRVQPLTLYGPVGLKRYLDCVQAVSKYPVDYPLTVVELEEERHCFRAGAFEILVLPLCHTSPCLGYRLQEDAKAGKFDAQKAIALGIPNGPERKLLQQGQTVPVGGRLIDPADVVGPTIPGRVIAYCTDTMPCENALVLANDCDVLVHDATFSDAYADRAEPTRHCTSRQAAQIAKDAGAQQLMLWHLSIRVHGEQEAALLAQAREVFPPAELPSDLQELIINRRALP